jgi:hypothetical protein
LPHTDVVAAFGDISVPEAPQDDDVPESIALPEDDEAVEQGEEQVDKTTANMPEESALGPEQPPLPNIPTAIEHDTQWGGGYGYNAPENAGDSQQSRVQAEILMRLDELLERMDAQREGVAIARL